MSPGVECKMSFEQSLSILLIRPQLIGHISVLVSQLEARNTRASRTFGKNSKASNCDQKHKKGAGYKMALFLHARTLQ